MKFPAFYGTWRLITVPYEPALDPVLSQTDQVSILTPYFSDNYFSNILPPTPSPLHIFQLKSCTHFSSLPRVLYALLAFDLNALIFVEKYKLRSSSLCISLRHSTVTVCYSFSLRTKHFPQCPILIYPQYIVAYRPVAKRWLCKQRPFLSNGSINTFPRQRIVTVRNGVFLRGPCRDVISKGQGE
jgi:hypothetical protein